MLAALYGCPAFLLFDCSLPKAKNDVTVHVRWRQVFVGALVSKLFEYINAREATSTGHRHQYIEAVQAPRPLLFTFK